jgi:arylsulfatase A-like enzyme
VKISSLRFVIVVAAWATAASSVMGAAPPPKPNVVLFLVDDMGWMDSGVYGSQYYSTPNIDRFAAEGMLFKSAYSQPLCSPTRASILTGHYTARHGITTASGHRPPQPAGYEFLAKSAPADQAMLMPESKNYLEPSYYTLAEALRDAGYRTAHIGKWHLGTTPPHWPEAQGFDTAFHCHPDPGPPGEYFSPYGVAPDGEATAKHKVGTITDGPKGEYIVDRQAAEAEKFITENRERPFYLNLWCYGVHGPWGHKAEYTAALADKKDPLGNQGNPIMASMLKSVDECFGRVLGALDRHALRENTIVIFTSDNGGNTHSNTPDDRKNAGGAKAAFLADWRRWAGDRPPTNNWPLRDGKGTLYEGGTRVPLAWSWRGVISKGAVNNTVVGPIDIYPTLLEMLELAPRAGQTFDGRSYAKVLRGTGELEPRPLFIYHPHAGNGRAGGVTVRTGDWKLFRWFGYAPGDSARYELYNMARDAGESDNRAAAEPGQVAHLDRLIDAFLEETGALYPRPNPAFKPKAAGPDDGAGPLRGWKLRGLTATPIDGGVRMTATGAGKPFIGTAQYRRRGPVEFTLRVRSAKGGRGELHWRAADEETFDAGHRVTFELSASPNWQEVKARVDAAEELVQFRLYWPLGDGPVDLGGIEVR